MDRVQSIMSFLSPSILDLLLAGLNGQKTARQFCLLGREFLVLAKNLYIIIEEVIDQQFSESCPTGNTSTSMGSRRRHCSLPSILFLTHTNDTW
jgi:hypothetical protein